MERGVTSRASNDPAYPELSTVFQSGTGIETTLRMNRHWIGILFLSLLPVLGFILAGVFHAPMLAIMGVLGAVVAGFVMGTAWLRPQHPTERSDAPAPEDRYDSLRQPP